MAVISAGAKPVSTFPKQAVIVVHGMGEQRPMDTIKQFVRAVWEYDDVLTKNGLPNEAAIWSKPDLRTGSLELRRITTRESIPTKKFPPGVRTDFYEMYWADLSGGATLSQLWNWIVGLLWRNPAERVPSNLLSAWILLWVITIAVGILTAAAAVPRTASVGPVQIWAIPPFQWLSYFEGWQLGLIAAVLAWIESYYLLPRFGRAVRYTTAKPDNIAARNNIRERGLKLLSELQKSEYERIIVVGHSLGSILAYDLVSYFWANSFASHTISENSKEFEALVALESAIVDLSTATKENRAARIENFRLAQRKLGEALRARPQPASKNSEDPRWLITDLITLGSPLSHASFLLAKDDAELAQRQREREYPTSPPLREELDPVNIDRARAAGFALEAKPQLLSFPIGKKLWQLHHATPFAVVRWTNIYDPAFAIFFGDIISGPIAPSFGAGVVDVNLKNVRGQSAGFTHTDYWAQPSKAEPQPQVIELRKALDLGAQSFP